MGVTRGMLTCADWQGVAERLPLESAPVIDLILCGAGSLAGRGVVELIDWTLYAASSCWLWMMGLINRTGRAATLGWQYMVALIIWAMHAASVGWRGTVGLIDWGRDEGLADAEVGAGDDSGGGSDKDESDGERNGDERDVEWPADMLCPISWVPMDDCVIAADGHSYQRKAIEEWIARKREGEVTGG
jgi:hypothetical protein